MRWILKQSVPPDGLAGREDLPPLIQRLLGERGVSDPEEVHRFFDPSLEDRHDPALLPDLDCAVERCDHALRRGEKIFLFGDYDVDGISSVTLLSRYLGRLGGELRTRIPERLTEGYGLSTVVIEEARRWGAGLIVAADSGTTAHDEIAQAVRHGIDVIVADHHQPEAQLPAATAVVNPWRQDSRYPFRDLAAAGVVTKILEQLGRVRTKRDGATPSPLDLLDLTALGTVADSVSLRDENRLFVRQGLQILQKGPRPPLRALLDACRLDPTRVTSNDLAFQVLPRLNAAGRMGEAHRALELLLSDDLERCRHLAALLEGYNNRRRELLADVVREAAFGAEKERAGETGEPLVLQSEGWHPGVLGIAAARLAERYNVPTILLSSDGALLRGSGRTARGCDLLGLVRRASEPLRAFGGHRAAIGLSLAREDFGRFRDGLLEAARLSSDLTGPRERVLAIDAIAGLRELDFTFLDWLDRLEPFGRDNAEPVLAVRGRVNGTVRVLKDRHLRFDVSGEGVRRQCIGFNLSGKAGLLESRSEEIHIAATLVRNVFRGEERLQLSVRDIALEDPFGDD